MPETKKIAVRPGSAEYGGLLLSVGELLEQARRTSARTVNAVMTATYWEVGRRIVEFEQEGKDRAGYGEQLLERLSDDLTRRMKKPADTVCRI